MGHWCGFCSISIEKMNNINIHLGISYLEYRKYVKNHPAAKVKLDFFVISITKDHLVAYITLC